MIPLGIVSLEELDNELNPLTATSFGGYLSIVECRVVVYGGTLRVHALLGQREEGLCGDILYSFGLLDSL